MAKTHLLDTSFLVALVEPRDRRHEDCRAVWERLRGDFVTVEGVLVEAAHMVRRNPKGFRTVLGLVAAVDAQIVVPDLERYERVAELMAKYSDVPMDFVDGLLVDVASELGIESVLTLDVRGFSTYRFAGRRGFTILPS